MTKQDHIAGRRTLAAAVDELTDQLNLINEHTTSQDFPSGAAPAKAFKGLVRGIENSLHHAVLALVNYDEVAEAAAQDGADRYEGYVLNG